MVVTSLLDIDLEQILRYVEKVCGIKLPRRVIEVSLVEKYSILHVRFKKPKEYELGEPIHPLIHLFRDSETEEITALEIIDINAILTELKKTPKQENY